YVWSPVYVDALVERDRDADGNSGNGLEERLYVQQDANWNVTAVLNTAGVVQERYVEDPYGQASTLAPDWSARGGSSFAWNYLHQGGRYDSTSGLYDFRSRAYSPALGRFVSQDPASFAGGDTNLYRAVGDSPAGYGDPSGLARHRGGEPSEMIPPMPQGPVVVDGRSIIDQPFWLDTFVGSAWLYTEDKAVGLWNGATEQAKQFGSDAWQFGLDYAVGQMLLRQGGALYQMFLDAPQ